MRQKGISMIMTPKETLEMCKKKIRPEEKLAFIAAFVMGLLIHLPIILSDIPNHDGLDSIYFDQNMITSGRWFLTVACGISSYFSLPWVIGLLALLYLALSAGILAALLELKDKCMIVLVSGLLVAFPALTSTFAYVFTIDGYMMALLLAILAVLLTKKYRLGFLWGGICLAFSMGIYQAYLPFAVLLSIYSILIIFIEGKSIRKKLLDALKYLYMGGIGVVLYYLILKILLAIQGKELDTYQGISSMAGAKKTGLLYTLQHIYSDFLAFTGKGNVLFNNLFSATALVVLMLLVSVVLIRLVIQKKWWKTGWFYLVLLLISAGLPIATNLILIISPEVTYHLLMRYQWVLYLICMVAFAERYGSKKAAESWILLLVTGIMVWNYAITDNIGYSNLEKRYEKTYAYCVRLLDRIEQTEGYYQGIPIAMIGVVGDWAYPETDITQDVTSGMIGIPGDSLLYTGENYQLFMQHYLGTTLNILPTDAMEEAYYQQFYRDMPGFPAEGSIQIVDGIMYIKTENQN